MFSKILYLTDFSDSVQKILEYVKKLKEAGTKDVVVVPCVWEGNYRFILWEIEAGFKDGIPEEIKGEILGKLRAKISIWRNCKNCKREKSLSYCYRFLWGKRIYRKIYRFYCRKGITW